MTIFISKDESELEDILSLLNEVNVTGICHSLIGFESTPTPTNPLNIPASNPIIIKTINVEKLIAQI